MSGRIAHVICGSRNAHTRRRPDSGVWRRQTGTRWLADGRIS